MKTLKKLFSVSAIVALLGTLAPMYAFGAGNSLDLDPEFPQAYAYAYANGITTQSEDNADMGGKLTRIALAKMIAKYAINVLNLTPDTSKTCNFTDVTAALDAQYDNGVTQACQLGLMGVNITAFRPNDLVTRGEFGTTFSRALNANSDNLAAMNAADPYYKEHLNYLNKEGIMKVIDPNMLEVRGYVMLMMMRSDENYTPAAEGCSAEELLACFNADDYDACIAACSDEEEPGEDQGYQEEKSGTLTAKISSESPDSSTVVPTGVERVPFLVFTLNSDEDITLNSATFEFEGYGDPANMSNFAIYNANNVKVSKGTPSWKQGKVTINFASNTVVKAKETFTVVSMLTSGDNSTYGLTLTAISSSAETLKGLPVKGSSLKNIEVSNKGVLTYAAYNSVDTDITVGKEATLASFKLSNNEKVEDIEISTIAIDVNSTKGELTNLALYADDEVIAKNLEINNKQIVANVGYTIEKNTKNVKFELKGTPTELVTDTVTFKLAPDAISAKGLKYGFNTAVSGLNTTLTIGSFSSVKGGEITVSFKKSDIDEANAGAEGVHVGTLTLTAKGHYNVDEMFITLNTKTDTGIVADLRLGGTSYDNYTVASGYKYTDIDLPAGQKVELPLVLDIDEDANNGSGLDFVIDLASAKFVDLDNNDKEYIGTALNGILSTVKPLVGKTITVSKPTLTLTTKTLTNRTGALGGEDYILSYKARIDTNDAGSVIVKKIVFTNTGVINHGATTGYNITEVVDSAKLLLDGEEYTTSNISTNAITFSNINAELAKSLSNKELKLSIRLKSADGYTGNIDLRLDEVVLKDTEKTSVTFTNAQSSVIAIASEGSFTNVFDTTETATTTMANFTKTAKLALAGAEDSVLLGKVKLTADVENFKVSEISLAGTDALNFEDSLKDLYLVVDGNTINVAGNSSKTAGTTTIKFENLKSKNIVVTTETPVYVEVRATFKAINQKSAEGGATAGANLSAIKMTVKAEGQSSNEVKTITTAGTAPSVTVVANTIDSVVLTPAESLVEGNNVIVGSLTITPSAQTWNIDSDGEILRAYLSSVTFTGSASQFSGAFPTLSLQRLGTGVDGSNDASKIEGATTFDIVANKVEFKDGNRDPSLTIEIKNVNTNIIFVDNVKYLLPEGATRYLRTTVK